MALNNGDDDDDVDDDVSTRAPSCQLMNNASSIQTTERRDETIRIEPNLCTKLNIKYKSVVDSDSQC